LIVQTLTLFGSRYHAAIFPAPARLASDQVGKLATNQALREILKRYGFVHATGEMQQKVFHGLAP